MQKKAKGMKIIKTLICAAAILMMSGICDCEDNEDTRDIRTARGLVTARDWVSSTIVVNYIRYHVPANVVVYKGSSKMGFTGININDPVAIRYYQDASGAYQVTEITVQYSGDFPI
jgi:hypothetical protein